MASVETPENLLARERRKAEWLDGLAALVKSVEGWARDLGWSTRRIEKRLDDAEIGSYHAPALIMQEETTRALLDPTGRSTPGSDGVVDLYLMPVFDDIARLIHRDGGWYLLDEPFEPSADGTTRNARPVSLSKAALQDVLERLKQHAG